MPTHATPTDTDVLDELVDADPHVSWIFDSWIVLGDHRERQQVKQALKALIAGNNEVLVETFEHPLKRKPVLPGENYEEPDLPQDFPRQMEATWVAFVTDDKYTRPLWEELGFRLLIGAAANGKGIKLIKQPL